MAKYILEQKFRFFPIRLGCDTSMVVPQAFRLQNKFFLFLLVKYLSLWTNFYSCLGCLPLDLGALHLRY